MFMQQICASLSTANTISNLNEGKSYKISLGILMQKLMEVFLMGV